MYFNYILSNQIVHLRIYVCNLPKSQSHLILLFEQVLLSHRYGGRHIPAKVPQGDMAIVMEEIKSWDTCQKDLKLIDKWYQLDKNAIPHEYILQPIIGHRELEELYQEEPGSKETQNIHSTILSIVHEPNSNSEEELERNKEDSSIQRTKKEKYEELVRHGKEVWKSEEPILREILRKAAINCMNKGVLKEEHINSFFQSSKYFNNIVIY